MTTLKNWLSRRRIGFSGVLGLILLACFLLTSLSIKSYGASYDETLIHEFANNNVRAYINLVFYKPIESLTEFYDLSYYGPAFWIGAKITNLPLQALFPALDEYDAWHIVNFATFLLGAWCLFCLGKRFGSPLAALAAALLYLTQPLLWGHGVMNPKDIPFMTFFLASVLAGIRMVEEAARPDGARPEPHPLFVWARRRRTGLAILVLLAGLSLIDLVSSHFLSRAVLSALIDQAYSSGPGNILHSLFLRLASHSDAIPAATYIDKAIQIVNVAEFAVLLLELGGGLAAWLAYTSQRNRWMVLASVTAGVTISIRILGPAAMGLVAVFAIAKLRQRSAGLLLAYLGIGLATAFATWPYLWTDPLGRLWASLQVMANFPWQGKVRFEGSDLAATGLPWYYLPKLMAIQLTLPLLGLAAAGLVMVRSALRRGLDWGLAAIPILWFLAPMAGVLILHPSMYDNFRQFLFILPPLFLFAAIAVEVVLGRIRNVPLKGAFVLAVLLPGMLAGTWLHPYEYTYYNALVGWTGQVERQYEGDYWYTSACEAARYLSSIAPDGARVSLTDSGIQTQFVRCADKKFLIFIEGVEKSLVKPDYSVIPTRFDDDLGYFRSMLVLNTIGRGKTGFMVVKKAP